MGCPDQRRLDDRSVSATPHCPSEPAISRPSSTSWPESSAAACLHDNRYQLPQTAKDPTFYERGQALAKALLTTYWRAGAPVAFGDICEDMLANMIPFATLMVYANGCRCCPRGRTPGVRLGEEGNAAALLKALPSDQPRVWSTSWKANSLRNEESERL
jgi:hypothetical protein